jgi:hypothetical protein
MTETAPRLRLSGANGNAYNLLALAHQAARKAKWAEDRWESVRTEATSGDYDNLLQTLMRHFDVR